MEKEVNEVNIVKELDVAIGGLETAGVKSFPPEYVADLVK